MLWVGSVEPWVPAEISSQAGHMAWEDQLGAAAPNMAQATLAWSHQPLLGRRPLLLQGLQLGLLSVGSGCYQHVRNVGRIKGAAPLLMERLCPGRPPGMLRKRLGGPGPNPR